jgi:hypothetical protein
VFVIAWPFWYIRRRRARERRPEIALEVLNQRYALGEIIETAEFMQARLRTTLLRLQRRLGETQERERRGIMGKRETQIILKMDERSIHLELR